MHTGKKKREQKKYEEGRIEQNGKENVFHKNNTNVLPVTFIQVELHYKMEGEPWWRL